MGLNDQAKNISNNRGSRKSIFQDGVKYRQMSGPNPISFRLLPAFNPADANPATSYLPSIDAGGNLTDWGAVVKLVRFVGHGNGSTGGRQDLLSLKTFDVPGHDMWCPLETLYRTITEDQNVWGYLIVDKGEPSDKNKIRKSFDRVSSQLIANTLDIYQPQEGVKVGVFTPGAGAKLIDRAEGLIYQTNNAVGVEEYIKLNYMNAYANGDLTDPNTGPVLTCEKGKDKGDFSAYKIAIMVDPNTRKVVRRPMDQSMMAQRRDLAHLELVLNVPTEEELVQSLVALLNGRSPLGYHEFALLRLAFPNFRIPEPPAAPAASSTVPSGFGAAPTSTVPYNAPVPAAPVPSTTYVVPSAPVPSSSSAVPEPPWVPVAPGPVTGEVAGIAANMAKAVPPGAAPQPTAPVAPGDPVVFNQAEFLARLRATK